MKKLFLLVAVVSIALTGCGKIEDAIDKLENRLDNLEQEKIPTINEQISAINTTLGTLDAMDKELKGYIDGLQVTADNLQKQINDTNTKIDEVKVTLQGEISTAKAEVLTQLEAAKTELENELKTINETIKTLQKRDNELDGKIKDLRTYVDDELGETTDWVEATFATLEQYNALVSEVVTIKEQIEAINKSITDLETKLTTKINEDIANAVSTLNADIQQKVKEITDGYTDAVKTAKEDITAAYTAAIQTAITSLDASLKAWVGEQLANYYTIAEVDAKITALQTTITDGDSALQKQLDELKSQLTTTKQEITEAYKTAIKEAIETNNGVINAQIASEIAIVNQRIDSEVATTNAKIATLEAQVNKNTEDIAKLLARIQSISYIPTYDDGKATVKYADNISQITLDFEVSPKDAVVELAKVWQSAVSVKAIYTQTRAVSFIDMPIIKFEADSANGVISITASGKNLSEAFFAGTQSASVRLSISDGNNSVTSDYVPMIAKEVELIPDNEIWYTSTDGAIVEPNDADVFGGNIVSNTYENGKGVIKFDGDVTSIGEDAFYQCTSLTSIAIPDSVTSIGDSAFIGCTSLTSVTIPDGVTSIGNHTFCACTSLTSITIPDSVTSIGAWTFRDCTSLTSITIPDSVTSIGRSAFSYCTSLTSVTIPDSVTSIENFTFEGCSSLTSITIPDSVTKIGERAFFECDSLTSVTIPDSVTSIGGGAFSGCTSLTSVYCKPTTPPTGGSSMFDNNASERKIYVPAGSVEAYKTTEYWSDYAASITTTSAVVATEWTDYKVGTFTHTTDFFDLPSLPFAEEGVVLQRYGDTNKYRFAVGTGTFTLEFTYDEATGAVKVPAKSTGLTATVPEGQAEIYYGDWWALAQAFGMTLQDGTPLTEEIVYGTYPNSYDAATQTFSFYLGYFDLEYGYVFTSVNDGDPTIHTFQITGDPEPTTPIQKCKIYATTTLSWSKMNIYAWNGISSAGWPGSAMTKETIGGVTYYSYEVDKGIKGNFIFNNGSAQTVDVTNVTVDTDVFYQINTTKSGGKYTVTKIADPR